MVGFRPLRVRTVVMRWRLPWDRNRHVYPQAREIAFRLERRCLAGPPCCDGLVPALLCSAPRAGSACITRDVDAGRACAIRTEGPGLRAALSIVRARERRVSRPADHAFTVDPVVQHIETLQELSIGTPRCSLGKTPHRSIWPSHTI